MFDLLLYVLVFGAAALVAKWMIGLHWTRAHTEYVTELLDCGRLSISERCSRAKTAVASIPEWIATEFSAARRYMAGNMLSVLCLLCVAGPLLLGIAYVKFTPGPLAELVPVSCVDGSEDFELPDYLLAEYEFTEPAACYYADGDGEDSDDVSSDEDIAGDATVRALNYKGLPKRAAAQKCDEGMQRGGKRAATYRIRSSV